MSSNPQTALPPAPPGLPGNNHPIVWRKWIEQLQRILSMAGGIGWAIVDKAGSKLTDIETRPHSDLQSILGTGDRHITANENTEITALDGLAAGLTAKTADATYAARTITGTTGEIDVANGDGISGNPTISLPAKITTPISFGGATAYTTIEADGTIKFEGDATVWEDLNFDPDSSGGPAVTLPDYVVINNVVHREFTSANNQLCGSSKEVPHAAAFGMTMYPHVHVFLKASESAGTTGVTFTLYWELRQDAATTSGSALLAATSTQLSGNGHKITISDATGFTGPVNLGANLALKIARTAGDAGDVIVTTYGVHYAIDTVGSRGVTSK